MHWHLYLSYFCIILVNQAQIATCAGSTAHLKEIVLGRCWYYKQFKTNVSSSTNCTALWDAFHTGFAYKDPCKLRFDDYKPFFDQLIGGDVVDKGLFWSGTYKAVHSYSDFDLRYTTLEDTLEGYMMNELSWCGNLSLSRNTSDGIDYNHCPAWSSKCDLTTPFWGQASKKFAERARGVVRVMVNGSRVSKQGDPIAAYSRSSFFGKYELPSFKVATISRLEVLVVHTINRKEREKCNTDSIKLLEKDAKSRGLKVVCYDDPDDVQHILCADHPNVERCRFRDLLGVKQDSQWETIGIALAVLSAVLLTVVVTIAAICLQKVYFGKKGDDTVVLT